MEEKLYTIDQVAEILGMHHKTIRKFITEGKLRANKVGKQWRITGHDLSVFMENGEVAINDKNKVNHEEIEYTASGNVLNNITERINVSTVVDINDINKEEYMRISNTLLALMNSKDPKIGKSTITMKYYDTEKSLKIMLWGNIKFIEDMLNTIALLVESIKDN